MAIAEPAVGAPSGRSSALLGLLVPAVVTMIAVIVAPRLHVGDALGLALASGIAIVPAIVALGIASGATMRAGPALLVGSLGVLIWIYVRGLTSAWMLPLQNVALVSLGHVVGSAIGRRIEHPAHALPAMVVAAAADIASVLHPEGPSHAIAGSDRALAALALAAPIPGGGITFVLGAGDLVFAALLLGVCVRHRLPVVRAAVLVMLGAALAVLAASLTAAPVPALVPIGALTVGFIPPMRKLAPRDRRTAWAAMVIAVAVVGGLLLRARLGG